MVSLHSIRDMWYKHAFPKDMCFLVRESEEHQKQIVSFAHDIVFILSSQAVNLFYNSHYNLQCISNKLHGTCWVSPDMSMTHICNIMLRYIAVGGCPTCYLFFYNVLKC